MSILILPSNTCSENQTVNQNLEYAKQTIPKTPSIILAATAEHLQKNMQRQYKWLGICFQ